jgi:hypothetical protein
MKFLALIITLLMVTSAASAQIPGVFDPKKDVNDLINTFQARMSGLISQAGGEARVTLVTAFQLSDALIKNLQVTYADSVHVTFDRLDTTQQKAFIDAEKMLDGIDRRIHSTTNKALQDWTDTNEIVADAASLWTSKPLVTSYGPAYIAPSSLMKMIRITIAGVRLHAGDLPKLAINNMQFDPDEYTDINLSYLVPRDFFPVLESGTSFVEAKLLFQRGQTWTKFPLGKVKSTEFRLLFTVLPENLGSYTMTRTVNTPREIRQQFTSPTLRAAKDGGGGAEAVDCYVPQDGFKFDLTTARLVETLHLAHKDDDHSAGTNDGGVFYKDNLKIEQRICVKVAAHTGCTECGAVTEGHLQVDMIKSVFDPDTSNSVVKPLTWANDSDEQLTDNALTQVFHIKLFDEISRIVSATDLQNLPFLTITPDPRNHEVYLRANRDWSGKE